MSVYFTWRDVERALTELTDVPWSALEVSVDSLLVHCTPGREEHCWRTLATTLGAAFDANERLLVLASLPDQPRVMSVAVSADGSPSLPVTARPLWSSPTVVEASPTPEGTATPVPGGTATRAEDCTILAFYSYKGGVGRTTAALAVLGELLHRPHPLRVLLIDADVEAPGLTWSLAPPDGQRLSLIDALAMVHDADSWQDVLPLLASLIETARTTIELDEGRREFWFLPAIRDMSQLFGLPVTMEQLVRRRGRAWIVGDLLLALGATLRLDAILVDLRAGVTEFSSPLLLDARVRSILVTSCNEQSVEGTVATVRATRKRAPRAVTQDVIVSFVPPDARPELFDGVSAAVVDALLGDAPESAGPVADQADRIAVYRVEFASELLHPTSLEDLLNARLPGTSMQKRASELTRRVLPEPAAPAPPPAPVTPARVAEEAQRLEYAEQNAEPGLLPIPALQKVLLQPRAQLPIRVVLGAKGAGKTFAWGQMVLARTLSGFAGLLELSPPQPDARIFPLLAPNTMGEALEDAVRRAEDDVLSGRGAESRAELRRALERNGVSEEPFRFWLRHIAARLGLHEGAGESAASLSQAVGATSGPVVAVIDGLEEAFQVAPGEPLNDDRRRLLRALLMDVPASLRELPRSSLGLVTFIRRDLASAAIPQNFGQFEAQHRETALQWSHTDALRLPVWLLSRLGWRLMADEQIGRASYDALRAALIPFWGEKLGGRGEAYTDRWVMAALSDFNGVLQARDVMRLVRFSAERHAARPGTPAFPLAARAIRDAVADVARDKVAELRSEVVALGPIFDKLRSADPERRKVPFRARDLGLEPDEVRFLEQQGLLLLQADELYLPELVRHGLEYKLAGPGRAKVLSMFNSAVARRRS